MKALEIEWGQQVAAYDVWLGSIYGAMLVKDSGAVTHLVVKRGLGRSSLRIISVESVEKCTSEAIYTSMPLDEALQQPKLKRLDGEQFIVALTPKTRVLTSDGKKLRLRGVRVSNEDHSLEWLVVSPWAFGRHRRSLLVPHDRIAEFTTGKVKLAIEASGLRAMPAYRQDHYVESDLRERLSNSSTGAQGDLSGVTLTVEEGVVAFHGNVKNLHTKEALRDITRQVRGAAGLLMDVRPDGDVEMEIATALVEHTRGNGGPLQVSSRLGMVQLLGHMPNEVECAALVRTAEAVPGVKGVALAGA
ncbi:MAG: hypothetical protein BZY79_02740 [SAR202 cluster bacterium Casp-Chloro-G4]|nr:BON domain-containing protein [Chloroflexota bacterium]PKB61649.1 MAG: hypothetical protein BZY79_02740 [SAR202 cluster bacterium Casp-Chloro-G4]